MRVLRENSIFVAALVACATREPRVAVPPDPCVPPTGLRGALAGPFDVHRRESACRAQQEAEALKQTEQAIADARDARVPIDVERAAWKAEEDARAAAAEAAEAAEAERLRKIAESREREAEHQRYQDAVAPLECVPPSWGLHRMRYDVLRVYEASPERDNALAAIERCRKVHLAWWKREGARRMAEKRNEFAIGIEDDFDMSFPRRRGALVAKVNGTQLLVSLKGELQGRPRHSEELVRNWCEEDDTQPFAWTLVFMFSKVVLKDEHGTFSCEPSGWPGSTNALSSHFFLSEAENPVSTAPGTRVIPR